MELVSQIMAAAGVLALLGGTLWWLRRRGFAALAPTARRGTGRRMECLERLPLGPQQMLHLIRVGERTLLLASSPAGCTLVESLSLHEVGHRGEALS